jgi:hypothetical protein
MERQNSWLQSGHLIAPLYTAEVKMLYRPHPLEEEPYSPCPGIWLQAQGWGNLVDGIRSAIELSISRGNDRVASLE